MLEVAKRIAEPLRAEAEDVPVLYPGPARVGRGRVTCALLRTETEEAAWIAEQIDLALRESADRHTAPDGLPWPEQEARGPLGYGDVAVLCRKRSQFPVIRRALEERGIPVEVVGLGGLIEVPEVRDIVATLRVLHDPTAGHELARLLTGPRWRLGPRDLVALNKRAVELAREARRDLRGPAAQEAEEEADPLRRTVLDLTAETGSLVDALDDLARQHGLHVSDQLSARFTDLDRIGDTMAHLRSAPPRTLAGAGVSDVADLSAGLDGLPPTDGVRILTADGTRVIVRPSGTEPKVKCYLEVVLPVAPDASHDDLTAARATARDRLDRVKADMQRALGI